MPLAARAALEEARRQAEKAPGDEEKQTVVVHKTVVLETLLSQKEKRRKRSQKAAENTMVSPTEPEAIIQKMKRGRGYASGYTPSVLANEKRVVVAVAVDPTNETAVIPEMLDQAVRTTGQSPDELLLDGGYANETVITTTIDRDISLLCPESGKPGKPKKKQQIKRDFNHWVTTRVDYPDLQTVLGKLMVVREELLLVLEYPWLPLHNNLMERQIREYVKRRKVSGGTRSDLGQMCRDTFASLKKTCKQHGISFAKYLKDRLSGTNLLPRLKDLVLQASGHQETVIAS